MENVRILAGFLTASYGGVERYMVENFRRLNRTEFSMDFLTSASRVPFEEELRQAGATVFHIPSFKHPVRCYREIRKILQRRTYDCLHLNISTALLAAAAIAGRKERVPVLVHSHSSGFHDSNRRREIVYTFLHTMCKPLLKRNADSFGACSMEAAAWMFPRKVVKSGNVQILKNAIDIETFEYDESVRRKVREQLNIAADTIVLGHVGNFMPVKNHSFLLEIFQAFLAINSDARLLLIGTGELEDEIKARAQEAQLTDKILFLGYQSKTQDFYQAMDALVLPSFFEGFPLVTVEAQAAGLPCYLSDTITKAAALTELVHFISIHSAPTAWAAEINRTIHAARYSRKEEIADKGYSLEQEVRSLERMYRQITKEKEKSHV